MSNSEKQPSSSKQKKVPAISMLSRHQANILFGTAAQPKRHSGTAQNGEQVASFKTMYDAGTNLITIVDSKGGKIVGTPAEVELLITSITASQSQLS